jgi:hypothetical protein
MLPDILGLKKCSLLCPTVQYPWLIRPAYRAGGLFEKLIKIQVVLAGPFLTHEVSSSYKAFLKVGSLTCRTCRYVLPSGRHLKTCWKCQLISLFNQLFLQDAIIVFILTPTPLCNTSLRTVQQWLWFSGLNLSLISIRDHSLVPLI